jgi:hypothetical protein
VNVGSGLLDEVFETGGACGQGKCWGLPGNDSR